MGSNTLFVGKYAQGMQAAFLWLAGGSRTPFASDSIALPGQIDAPTVSPAFMEQNSFASQTIRETDALSALDRPETVRSVASNGTPGEMTAMVDPTATAAQAGDVSGQVIADPVRTPARTPTGGTKPLADLDTQGRVVATQPQAQMAATAWPGKAVSQETARIAMMRGNEAMERRDVISARRFYEVADSGGLARAATAVGSTYDPIFLQERGIRGLRGDANTAARWYEKAIEAGDAEARPRLDKLLHLSDKAAR